LYPIDRVILDVTNRCNLSCSLCRTAKATPIDLDFKRAAPNLSKSTHTINLSGGEPLLRSDIIDIVRYLKNKGFRVTMTTNGVVANPTIAQALSNQRIDCINLSIDGTKAIHDFFRGVGSFDKATCALTYFLEENIAVRIHTTIWQSSDFLEDLARYLEPMNIKQWEVRPVIGRKMNRSDYCNYRKSIVEKILFLRKSFKKMNITSNDPLLKVTENSAQYNQSREVIEGGCMAGICLCYIDAAGTIFPCSFLKIPLGSIFSAKLDDVWQKSEILSGLRNRKCYFGKCRTCIYLAMCGGCRAIAFNLSGKLLSADPTCWF
jgi:AdoMet-dependent heme synthase